MSCGGRKPQTRHWPGLNPPSPDSELPKNYYGIFMVAVRPTRPCFYATPLNIKISFQFASHYGMLVRKLI
ncbi:hypothetical protein MCP1_70126 [Candidatus Terasakiella magnetica]|nr:hypothetical protein MCP1_70126 [Candidatus Terasakiella magnetica]